MRTLHIDLESWDSGITNYALTVAVGLQQLGEPVWFAGWPEKFPLQQAKKLALNIQPITSIYSLALCLKSVKPELIDAYTGKSLFWAVAALSLARLKIPVVRTYADARLPKNNFFNRRLYRHKAAKIITAAKFLENSFIDDLQLPPEKIVTIYQGIDTGKFSSTAVPVSPVRIGMVGRLDPVKGHRDFLLAAAEIKKTLPTAKFIIAGEEKNIKTAELKNLAGTLGVGQKITFVGYHPNIAQLMNTCSIGVISSLGSEAVSRALLEWMACARPVVATAVGCIPEIIKEGENGFVVPPGNSQLLAKKILSLLKNPALARTIGQKNRLLVEQKFSQNIFIKNTADLYQRIVS
ncbi:MAG: glycosyltransferase family 4 protein [Elusimicrobiota bacterium]